MAATLQFFDRAPQDQLAQAADVKSKGAPYSIPYSIRQSRSTAEHEGLYNIRQEARRFLEVHNKKI